MQFKKEGHNWPRSTSTSRASTVFSAKNFSTTVFLSTVNFSDATVNGASAGLVADQGVQLIDSSGNPIATPSAPVNGDEFNDCAWATNCLAP